MRIHRSCLVFFPLVTDVWKGPSGYNVRLGYDPNAVNLSVGRRCEQGAKQRWTHERHHHENETSHAI